MIARFTPCDRDLLRQVLLRDDLSTDHQAQLETHLSACDICRSELERLAGGENWLFEVREHLSSSEVPPYRSQELESHAALRGYDYENLDEREDRLNFLEPSSDPSKLGRLGIYEIESVIGRGGMGIVLKALDTTLNRHVAIKVLAAELATSGAARRRFARESQAAAAIAHEHVVAIHAVDNSGKLPFLVMPYIPGKSLQERLDESGPLAITEVLRIGLQAASGLAAAHAQGLVHRDIKPANILLENGIERVRITDFGLARTVDDASQTQSGFIAGTPQYMAPEQARGEPVDHRADLFSLGSVMYAMCTGRPPFRAETTFAVLRRICEDTPRPLKHINPEIPDWLQAIISQLHARDPAERFQSAAEVASLLEQYLAHLQQPATFPLPKFHLTFTGWRHRWVQVQQRVALWMITSVLVTGLVILVRYVTVDPVRSTSSIETAKPTGSSTAIASPIEKTSIDSQPESQSPSLRKSPPDFWEAWDQSLNSIEQAIRDYEQNSVSHLPLGSPIDARQELQVVSDDLRAVEQELKPPSATSNNRGGAR